MIQFVLYFLFRLAVQVQVGLIHNKNKKGEKAKDLFVQTVNSMCLLLITDSSTSTATLQNNNNNNNNNKYVIIISSTGI